MSEEYQEEPINRRKFLKVAAVTAVAATATGAGASLLNSPKSTAQPLTQPLTAAIAKTNPDELINQLAVLQVENARLQAHLELANYRLARETAVNETDTAVPLIDYSLNLTQ